MPIRKEIEMLAEYCIGLGLNVGCGDIPIMDSIGVDIYNEAKAAKLRANAMSLGFHKNSLDYILASAVFEHMELAPIVVLRYWLKLIKVGGHIAILVPDASFGIWSMTGDTGRCGKLVKSRREMEHLHAFTVETLKVLFEFAGMDIIRLEVIDRKPIRCERTILCVGRKNEKYE